MNVKSAFLISISSIFILSCSNFTRIQRSENLDMKYKAAIKYYEGKKYSNAGLLFEELIPILKGQADAEKAQFYYAYCQYFQGQLVLSAYYFKKFYETFPRSDVAEEAYYMHCISLYEDSPEFELDQTNTKEALVAIQNFLERFPKTKYLEECNGISDKLTYKLELKSYHQAKLFHRMRDFRASVITFENFVKDYPSSKFLEEAYFTKIEAQYNFANISIDTKKRERFQSAIDYYFFFIDKYPSSRYLKDAEKIYTLIQLRIAELDNPVKKKHWLDWLI